MSADKHLLFGLLALQNEFIDKQSLVAALGLWMANKQKPLDQVLVEQRALTPELAALLNQLVNQHVERRGGDVQASLNALSPQQNIRAELEQIADEEIHATLAQLKATDPFQTVRVGEVHEQGARFQILRPLDRGGLGIVSVAVDKELNREVALKEIRRDRAHDSAFKQKFLLEAEVTGGLEHPNIVPVYGLGTYSDGRPYYAMRLIKGDNLREHIRTFHASIAAGRKPFDGPSLRKLLRRFLDVCEAIDYAHSRGILHRDLKPGNVMLGKYGETLVVDWGLAKPLHARPGTPTSPSQQTPIEMVESLIVPLSGSDDATRQGSMIGTPAYAPPEQLSGRLHEVDVRSDVYGLGAILYELLTGTSPGVGKTLEETIQNVIHGRITSPRALDTRIPAALEAVCMRAIALEPAKRYSDASQLRQEVERWLDDLPVAAYRESIIVRLRRWLRAHQTLAVAASATILVSILGLSIFSTVLSQKNNSLSELNSDLDSKNTELEESYQREREISAELKVGKSELERNSLELQLRNAYLACESGRIENGLASMVEVLRRAQASQSIDIEQRIRRLLTGWSHDYNFSLPVARSNATYDTFLPILANYFEFSTDGQWVVTISPISNKNNSQSIFKASPSDKDDLGEPPTADSVMLYRLLRSESESSGVEVKLQSKWTSELMSNFHFFGSSPQLAYTTTDHVVVRDVLAETQKEFPFPDGFFKYSADTSSALYVRYHSPRDRLIVVSETGIQELDIGSGTWKLLFKLKESVDPNESFAISSSEPLRVAVASLKGIQIFEPGSSAEPKISLINSKDATKKVGSGSTIQCNSLDFDEDGTTLFAGGSLTDNPDRPTETGWYQAWKLTKPTTDAEGDSQWRNVFPQPRTCAFDTLLVRLLPQGRSLLVATGPNLFDSSPSTLQLASLDTQALTRAVTSLHVGEVLLATGRGKSKRGAFTSIAIGGPQETNLWRVANRTRLLKQSNLGGRVNCAVFAGPQADLFVGIDPPQAKMPSIICRSSPEFEARPSIDQRVLGQIRSICADKESKQIFWTGETTGSYMLETRDLSVFARKGASWFSTSQTQKNLLGLSSQDRLLAVLVEENATSGFLGKTKQSQVLLTNSDNGRPRGTISLKDIIIQALTIGPADTLVTGCSDHTIRFWDMGSKTETRPSIPFAAAIELVVANVNAPIYAVTTSDGAVHILAWDNPSKQKIVLPHIHRVRAASLNSDGTLIATGCEDGSVYLWDTATGESLGPAMQHDQPISAVAFSPDSRWLFTGAGETGSYWEVPSAGSEPAEQLINHIGYLTGLVADESAQLRPLSHAERLQMLRHEVSGTTELYLWPDTQRD